MVKISQGLPASMTPCSFGRCGGAYDWTTLPGQDFALIAHDSASFSQLLIKNVRPLLHFIQQQVFVQVRRDVRYILDQGWAQAIHAGGLSHCHLCVPRWAMKLVASGSYAQCMLIYHSGEALPNANSSNIIARRVVGPSAPGRLYVDNTKTTIHPDDLGCMDIVWIGFTENFRFRLAWASSLAGEMNSLSLWNGAS
ncbi:MAG: hypothetical protein ACR2RL_06495 [Gammaproteobacteria bacterium]